MKCEVLQSFKTKNGRILTVGEVIEVDDHRKILRLGERGLARPLTHSPGHPTLPEASKTGLKTQNPGHSGNVAWTSPLFGRLEAPVLEMREATFVLHHPLTGEVVELSKDWLASLDERSAIIEHDGGLPREEADDQAKREFFGLFRKGERP